MFILDIETLSTESTTVVLSLALLHVDEKKEGHTWESLMNDAFFVKLSVDDQVKNYKRTLKKSTLEWWAKQSKESREISFTPKKSDLTVKDAIAALRGYVKLYSKNPKNELVWTRGSLDQMATDSLFYSTGEENALFPFWCYRDVRTFIDFNTETGGRGYAEIDPEKYPGVWDKNVVVKHSPKDDICLDILQILYSK